MTTQATIHSPTIRPFAGIAAAFQYAFAFLERNSRGARGAREAERLFAMSDAELAELGISRDRILFHAFGPQICL